MRLLAAELLLSAFAFASAAIVLVLSVSLRTADATWLFDRMIVLDGFSVFFKILLGLALLAVVWMSLASREVRGQPNEGEYYALLLASALGMFLMASAGTLLMAYLSLEFVSLLSYVLAGFKRRNRQSSEAALKYAIYGGVASGVMLYGMSLLYGLAGSLSLAALRTAVAGSGSTRSVWDSTCCQPQGDGTRCSRWRAVCTGCV